MSEQNEQEASGGETSKPSSSPSSASPSPSSSQWSLAPAVLVPYAAMGIITAAWWTDRIHDWKWALGGIVACQLPMDAVKAVLTLAVGRLLPERK